MSFLPKSGREYGILGVGGLVGSVLTVLIPWGWKKITAPKPAAPAVEDPKTGTGG